MFFNYSTCFFVHCVYFRPYNNVYDIVKQKVRLIFLNSQCITFSEPLITLASVSILFFISLLSPLLFSRQKADRSAWAIYLNLIFRYKQVHLKPVIIRKHWSPAYRYQPLHVFSILINLNRTA